MRTLAAWPVLALRRQLDLQSTARRNAWSGMVELGARRRQREDAERALALAAAPGLPAVRHHPDA